MSSRFRCRRLENKRETNHAREKKREENSSNCVHSDAVSPAKVPHDYVFLSYNSSGCAGSERIGSARMGTRVPNQLKLCVQLLWVRIWPVVSVFLATRNGTTTVVDGTTTIGAMCGSCAAEFIALGTERDKNSRVSHTFHAYNGGHCMRFRSRVRCVN